MTERAPAALNILLVGASGFIGHHLLAALSRAGHRVVATGRRGGGPHWPGVSWQALDLDRLAEDAGRFAWPPGTELLINAAGVLSRDERALALTQDRGSRALFDLAARHGARVLQVSALGAGLQDDVPFLVSKAAADAHLLGMGIPAVVLRPSLVLGPGGTSSGWLMALSPWPLIPLPETRALWQPLHVDDLVGAVLALIEHWPAHAVALPLVGPQRMRLSEVIDHLRAAQGRGPGRYRRWPPMLARWGAWLGDRLGWRALNSQSLRLAGRDNLGDARPLAQACGYRAAPLATRLLGWPAAATCVQAALRPPLLAVLALVWLGTALVCLGPGRDWSLRIMAEAGVGGRWATLAVVGGSLCDAVLGVALLVRRWRRAALAAQLSLMAAYTLIITVILPHYWFDPFAAVGKNLVMMVATFWLLWTEPRR